MVELVVSGLIISVLLSLIQCQYKYEYPRHTAHVLSQGKLRLRDETPATHPHHTNPAPPYQITNRPKPYRNKGKTKKTVKRMVQIKDLPVEILTQIIKGVGTPPVLPSLQHRDHQIHDLQLPQVPSRLAALCTVCKAFRLIATPLLYSDVVIRTTPIRGHTLDPVMLSCFLYEYNSGIEHIRRITVRGHWNGGHQTGTEPIHRAGIKNDIFSPAVVNTCLLLGILLERIPRGALEHFMYVSSLVLTGGGITLRMEGNG